MLERFYVTRAASWFEDHIGACACACLPCAPLQVVSFCGRADYYCIQSQLFSHATMNVYQQSRLLWKHTRRISND